MQITSRNQILKLNQITITKDGSIEHCGSNMTIGEFEGYCRDKHGIEIDNISCQRGMWNYCKSGKDGNWYLK